MVSSMLQNIPAAPGRSRAWPKPAIRKAVAAMREKQYVMEARGGPRSTGLLVTLDRRACSLRGRYGLTHHIVKATRATDKRGRPAWCVTVRQQNRVRAVVLRPRV